MIHALVEERHRTCPHVFILSVPIKQKCSIIGSLKLNLWIGDLKASYNFIEGAWEERNF